MSLHIKSILFIHPYLDGPSAARWIFQAWRTGFEHEGYICHFCTADQITQYTINLTPDLIWCDIVSSPIEDHTYRSCLDKLRTKGSKILLWLYWPLWDLPEMRQKIVINEDIADLYFGEREKDSIYGFEEETGKIYHTLPMFANSSLHKLGTIRKELEYDITFVGAKLPKKKWFNNNIIKPLSRKYKVGLFGTNWTMTDNIKRVGSRLLRLGKMNSVASHIDRTRFSISDADEVDLYRSSKICLNFHERADDLSQPHHVMNHRAFKIVACGGFQICDQVKGMANYFNDDELCMVDCNQKQWFDQIEYFLHAEKERNEYVRRGMNRVNREHLDFHRVRLIESLISNQK